MIRTRFGVGAVISAACLLTPIPAGATAASWVSHKGAGGQTLTVSQARSIPARGATITVIGKGYDETVGIYVAMCVVPKKDQLPSPCGGGADKSGASGASVWVSSNPPPYGVGLAVPFGIDGKFKVKIKIGPMIGKIDCRKTKCAIVTRADHTNSEFRGADVFVPVTFATK